MGIFFIFNIMKEEIKVNGVEPMFSEEEVNAFCDGWATREDEVEVDETKNDFDLSIKLALSAGKSMEEAIAYKEWCVERRKQEMERVITIAKKIGELKSNIDTIQYKIDFAKMAKVKGDSNFWEDANNAILAAKKEYNDYLEANKAAIECIPIDFGYFVYCLDVIENAKMFEV